MKLLSPMSLVAKLRFIIIAVTSGLLLLSSTVSIVYLTYDSFRSSENFFSNHTEIVASNLSAAVAFDDEIGTQAVLNTMTDDAGIIAAVVTNAAGDPMASIGDSEQLLTQLDRVNSSVGFEELSNFQTIWISKPIAQGSETLGFLYVVADHEEVRANLLNQVIVTVFILLVLMLLVVPIAQLLARFVSNPVNSLARTMQFVSTQDDFSIRAKKFSEDEIGLLVDQFNTMLQQIEERDHRLQDYSNELENSIKELEKTKEAAIHASEVKSQFLANMSHEIRTPMNGVVGMLDLLKDSVISSEQRDYIEIASKSATGLLSIINDILDLSKIEAGKMSLNLEPAAPGEIVEEVVSILYQVAARKQIQLVSTIEPAAYEQAEIDPTRLRQVLLNLIGNSVKFTNDGYVNVSCSIVKSERGKMLQISVADTGIGISEENHAKLFDAFDQADSSTTRQYGGTGLGLTICRQVINLMDGEISVESELDRGSVFSFSVPLKVVDNPTLSPSSAELQQLRVGIKVDNRLLQESVELMLKALKVNVLDIASKSELEIVITDNANFSKTSSRVILITDKHSPQSGKSYSDELVLPLRLSSMMNILLQSQTTKPNVHRLPTSKLASAKVLLVEDNLINQMVAVKILEKFGINCDKAEDGFIAVRKAAASKYDLILMDCQMPNMDGFEATAKIREQQAQRGEQATPIVALTANAMEEDEKRCLDAGMDGYLSKPIDPKLMRAALEDWLSVKSAKHIAIDAN